MGGVAVVAWGVGPHIAVCNPKLCVGGRLEERGHRSTARG